MMVKKSVFESLSGFDEKLFMYVEDMEFCFRARQAGYFTYFTPEVQIVHTQHGSSSRANAIKNIYKGIFHFHKKHGTAFSYMFVKTLFKSKALALVVAGKMLNNKDLSRTYSAVLKT
jgi:GT2 family glycosyltransferase